MYIFNLRLGTNKIGHKNDPIFILLIFLMAFVPLLSIQLIFHNLGNVLADKLQNFDSTYSFIRATKCIW